MSNKGLMKIFLLPLGFLLNSQNKAISLPSEDVSDD